MPALKQWDIEYVESTKRDVARYEELGDQVITHARESTPMPEADLEEYKRLESALAHQVPALLRMIAQLQG